MKGIWTQHLLVDHHLHRPDQSIHSFQTTLQCICHQRSCDHLDRWQEKNSRGGQRGHQRLHPRWSFKHDRGKDWAITKSYRTITNKKHESSERSIRTRAVWKTLTYKVIWHTWIQLRRYQSPNSKRDLKIKPSTDKIINPHRVANPNRQRAGPRQIIARLNSVDTKLRILRSFKLFQKNVQNQGYLGKWGPLKEQRQSCIYAGSFVVTAEESTKMAWHSYTPLFHV